MTKPASSPYLPTDDPSVYESTELATAGWYDEGQHGGALAALVAGHVEDLPTLTPMQVTRFTLEIFRVVPLVPLTIETSIVREGKKIQVIEARVLSDGRELSRAHVQRLRLAEVGLPPNVEETPTTLPLPADLVSLDTSTWGIGPHDKPMFHRHAIEVREAVGGFDIPGPGAVWIRLVDQIIDGRPNTPLQRLLAISDFCNGISRFDTGPDWLFMNPDLSVNINRLPRGEWVALDAVSEYSGIGRGMASGTLWDEISYLGRSTQTLYLDRSG
jgi:hypothetical protein